MHDPCELHRSVSHDHGQFRLDSVYVRKGVHIYHYLDKPELRSGMISELLLKELAFTKQLLPLRVRPFSDRTINQKLPLAVQSPMDSAVRRGSISECPRDF